MKKIFLFGVFLLAGLLSGTALGWLSYIRSVPSVWLIIASAVLIGIVATIVALVKKRKWVKYLEQVPVWVRVANAFLVTFSFFNAHFLFTSFNISQFIIGFSGGVITAIYIYIMSKHTAISNQASNDLSNQ